MVVSHSCKMLVAFACLCWQTGYAAPSVKLTVTAPTNTAGADDALTGIYATTPWLPCTESNETFGLITPVSPASATLPKDALQFDIAVTNQDLNGDNKMDYDLYIFLLNPNATGSASAFKAAADMSEIVPVAQVWAVMNASFSGNPSLLKPFANLKTLKPAQAVFKKAGSFTSPTLDATLLEGPTFFDTAWRGPSAITQYLPQGPWIAVAMLINAKKLPWNTITANQLQNPQNWDAWDARSFILGTPFPKPTTGTGFSGGNGQCH